MSLKPLQTLFDPVMQMLSARTILGRRRTEKCETDCELRNRKPRRRGQENRGSYAFVQD